MPGRPLQNDLEVTIPVCLFRQNTATEKEKHASAPAPAPATAPAAHVLPLQSTSVQQQELSQPTSPSAQTFMIKLDASPPFCHAPRTLRVPAESLAQLKAGIGAQLALGPSVKFDLLVWDEEFDESDDFDFNEFWVWRWARGYPGRNCESASENN